MAEIKNEIVLNVITYCENADEVVGAIGALVTTGLVSMNDAIKTMYNQYAEVRSCYDAARSYGDEEIAALNEENAELVEKVVELKNELEKAKAEMMWGDDTPAKLVELLKELL